MNVHKPWSSENHREISHAKSHFSWIWSFEYHQIIYPINIYAMLNCIHKTLFPSGHGTLFAVALRNFTAVIVQQFYLFYVICFITDPALLSKMSENRKLAGLKNDFRSENPCFTRSQTKLVWAACVSHFIKQSLQDSSIYLLKTVQTSFNTTETGKFIWHKYFFLFELMINIFLSELFPASMIFWRSRAIKCLL